MKIFNYYDTTWKTFPSRSTSLIALLLLYLNGETFKTFRISMLLFFWHWSNYRYGLPKLSEFVRYGLVTVSIVFRGENDTRLCKHTVYHNNH